MTAIFLAGIAAGTINTVVGSGTLITFPTLLAIGVPPVTANVSNTLGLVPGSLSGAIGYRRAEARGQARPEHGALWVWGLVYLAGVYGGYFGAAQGVLLMAILGVGLSESMQRNNATKNVLALLVNLVAAVVFVFVAHIDWAVAGLIALGSVIGGQIGATVG